MFCLIRTIETATAVGFGSYYWVAFRFSCWVDLSVLLLVAFGFTAGCLRFCCWELVSGSVVWCLFGSCCREPLRFLLLGASSVLAGRCCFGFCFSNCGCFWLVYLSSSFVMFWLPIWLFKHGFWLLLVWLC